MRVLCETCGEVGSNKQRFFINGISEKRTTQSTITKMESLACLMCGGRLFVDFDKYETLSGGEPWREPTLLERVGLKKLPKELLKNKKQLKKCVEEYKELDNEGTSD